VRLALLSSPLWKTHAELDRSSYFKESSKTVENASAMRALYDFKIEQRIVFLVTMLISTME
jgi:hypothetical protein